MSQRHENKPRKCSHCDMWFPTTAKEIKDHAKKCAAKKKDNARKT